MMMLLLSAMYVLLVELLVMLPILHVDGLKIIPNIADICNSPSLETVVGIPADQTCIKHNNHTRCWYTYIPESAKKKQSSTNNNTNNNSSGDGGIPLVFDLHGYNLCAVYQANFTGWQQVAEEQGFVIVWPQGNMNANLSNNPCWDFGNCCCSLGPPPPPPDNTTTSNTSSTNNIFDSFVPGPDMDDEGFLRQVVSNVVAEAAALSSEDNGGVTIDTKRIYFGGHSNGCMMSQAMAALSSDLVAAVCCHASSLPVDVANDYVATSVQVVYGDLDTSIEGFFGSPTHIIDTWSTINDCQSSNRTIVDDEYAINTRFNCSNDTIVQTIELFDVGHFPFQGFNPNNSLSVGEYPGAITPTVDTARLSWDFCKQFGRQVAPILPEPIETVPADVFITSDGSGGSETDDGTNDGDASNGDDGANHDTDLPSSSSSSIGADHAHRFTFVSLSTISIIAIAMVHTLVIVIG